jgi:Zn-dependent M16 (insulinase) family peptidase
MTDEIWSGLSQMEFCRRLAGMDIQHIIAKLNSLRETIASAGVIVNITGCAAAIDAGSGAVSRKFSSFGPPRPQLAAADADFARIFSSAIPAGAGGAVFSFPSLQIGYCSATFRSAAYDTPAQAAEAVAAHQLSTGALWEEIRMKGGAYGAHASSDSLETCFSISTYRDPNPLRSVESFQQILKNLAVKQADYSAMQEDNLVKMIIGTYGREVQPRTSAEKGFIDFIRFLYGITDDYRQRKLQRIISVSNADVCDALNTLAAQTPGYPVIIGGTQIAGQAAGALGVEPYMLPV